jgi:hypothetical protein
MMKRSGESGDEQRYSIGRLLAPRDEAIDLDADAWAEALSLTRDSWKQNTSKKRAAEEPSLPNGPAIRYVRGFGGTTVKPHPERGLLLLYLIDPRQAFPAEDSRCFPPDTPPIVGFGVSFPGSKSGAKVLYKVNNVLWEQEYGSSE